jgi:hypothetical protein
MKYNTRIVLAYWKEMGLPHPVSEYEFSPPRKWRFDFAWPDFDVALEVDGGIWLSGRHTRGAGYVKDMEKFNEAACLGWRILKCQPGDVCTLATVDLIKRAISRGA